MSRQEDRIDAWWNAFQEKAPDIDALFSRKGEWDLPGWMQEHFQPIHPHLMWEFYAYRLPEDHDMAVQTVEARTRGDTNSDRTWLE